MLISSNPQGSILPRESVKTPTAATTRSQPSATPKGIRRRRRALDEQMAPCFLRTKRPILRCMLAVVGPLVLVTFLLPAHAETSFPAWSECREKCDLEFQQNMRKCQGLRGAAFKMCESRQMEAYSRCLAKCPPEPPPDECPKGQQ